MDRRYRIGVDIGGTFTDLVLIDDSTGERSIGKILTTPKDPSDAVEKDWPSYSREKVSMLRRSAP